MKPISCIIQNMLGKIGIAIHNPFRDECMLDFGCCNKNFGRYWLRIDQHHLPFRCKIDYEKCNVNKEIHYAKISKWYIFGKYMFTTKKILKYD